MIVPSYACIRCGRAMKRASETGMGEKCARSMYGTKPRRQKAEPVVRDTKTRDLFPEVAHG